MGLGPASLPHHRLLVGHHNDCAVGWMIFEFDFGFGKLLVVHAVVMDLSFSLTLVLSFSLLCIKSFLLI